MTAFFGNTQGQRDAAPVRILWCSRFVTVKACAGLRITLATQCALRKGWRAFWDTQGMDSCCFVSARMGNRETPAALRGLAIAPPPTPSPPAGRGLTMQGLRPCTPLFLGASPPCPLFFGVLCLP